MATRSQAGWRVLLAASLALASVTTAVGQGGDVAFACDCTRPDPVDAITLADAVFTAEVVANEGSEFGPVWRFRVDGLVKGELEELSGGEVVVIGEDWHGGCGTDFGQSGRSVVVYAHRTDDGLRAMSCMPPINAATLEHHLGQIRPPTGTGPPAAVLVGVVGLSDIAVLDARGRTIGRADIGARYGVAAHCDGTTLAAVVAWDEDSRALVIVDLSDFSVVDRRPIHGGNVLDRGARVACLDEGDHVVTTSGFGLYEGAVTVATSNAPGTEVADASRSIDGVGRVVPHPAGTLIVLPNLVGEPVTALSSTDLEPLSGVEADLPEGASAIDGDVSPDGSRLAVLVTLSGHPAEYDTGGSHVVTIDVVDGVPVAGSASVVDLSAQVVPHHGQARHIRWLDDETWVIERGGGATRGVEFLRAGDGARLAVADVGWGSGLAAIPDGVLVVEEVGVRFVDRAGAVHPGDPASEPDRYIDRILSIAPIRDAPQFDVGVADPGEPLTIRPVAPETPDTPAPELDQVAVVEVLRAIVAVADRVVDLLRSFWAPDR